MSQNWRGMVSNTIWQHRGEVAGAPPAQPPRRIAEAPGPRIEGLLLVAPSSRQSQMRHLSELIVRRGLSGGVLACDSVTDLRAVLKERTVHILVIHLEMAERIGGGELAQVRHDHPNIHWVLVWQGRAPNLIDLAIRTRARGAIDLTQPAQAVTALEQVAAGEFWLPRWVLHELYVALLDERRVLELGIAPPQEASRPALTAREAEVLVMLHEGLTNREIGDRLGISVSTVKKHLQSAFTKRGLHSRRQARA